MKLTIEEIILYLLLAALIAALIFTPGEGQSEPYCLRLVQAMGGLRVRDEPDLAGKVVYLLEDAETVIVFEERNGWYRVGKNIPPHVELGWVCGEYLR